MISVIIIGSCDRDNYLRDALESVRQQTARHLVQSVVVADDGTREERRKVCAEFGDLPIVHGPEAAASRHFDCTVMSQLVRTALVAFLGGNDWWAKEHLEDAAGVLNSRPDCVATYAHFFESDGAQFPPRSSRTSWRIWISTGCDYGHPVLFLDKVNTLLASLLDRSLHYSTLVARSEVVRNACRELLKVPGGYDDDRILSVLLSLRGRVGYLTRAHGFVRASQLDSLLGESRADYWKARSDTTRWFAKTYPYRVARAAARFNKAAATVPHTLAIHEASPVFANAIYDITGEQWLALEQECELNLSGQASRPRIVKSLMKQLCPPGLLTLRRKLLNVWSDRLGLKK